MIRTFSVVNQLDSTPSYGGLSEESRRTNRLEMVVQDRPALRMDRLKEKERRG